MSGMRSWNEETAKRTISTRGFHRTLLNVARIEEIVRAQDLEWD